MNHQNLLIENKNLKKHNKELLAKLREYDIVADKSESQDPRSKAKSITDGLDVQFLGNMSNDVMEQMVKTFEENYDEGAVNNLHGKSLEKYHWAKIQYDLIKAELKRGTD